MADQMPGLTDPMLNRFFLSPQDRANIENGKKIVREFYRRQTGSDNINFFQKRNARWIEILLWAKGSQGMSEFLDYMSIQDATKAWVNLDMTQQRIAAKFMSTLVTSMSKNVIYPCVKAVDDGSLTEKESRLLDALFRMHEIETIKALQDQSGIQIESPNAYVPDDETAAKVYFELQDRLLKEIRFEQMLEMVKKTIHFDRVTNPKTIFDLIAVNFACTKIERLAPKKYTIRKCIATNMVYNFFMNDSGQTEIDQIGEFYNLKVKDLRQKFGKSEDNPMGLSEKDIYELAKKSSYKNIGTFNFMWNESWASQSYYLNRPYDDCNILVFDCEIDCGEDVYFVSKKDNFGKENIIAKNGIPYQQKKKDGSIVNQPKSDDTEIIKRKKNTWMRGVYAPYGDVMLYWGRPDLIISEYTNTAKPLSSYTVNIPNNDGDYVPSLFERILEPLREYTLTKLKRKQLIAQLTQTGYKIDVESARNLDLGNGDTIDWQEVVRIKLQTGIELWSSKGVNPLEKEAPPISQGTPDDTIQKILGLTEVLNGIANEIRDLIGVPSYRDGSDVGDRTSGKLSENQLAGSYNVTDFIVNANMQLWEETFYKVCLLHWNDIVKEEPESKEDMLNSRFEVSVKMKITEYEKELIEQDIQRFSQMPDASGQPLITPKDAIMIRNIENYQLAILYLDAVVKENRKKAIQDSQRLQQENAKLQQDSNEQAAKKAQQLQEDKIEAEEKLEDFKYTKQKEIELLKGFLVVCAKDESGQLIQQLMPAIQQLVPNITIPLAIENQQMKNGIQQQAQQQEIAQQQPIQQGQLQMQQQPEMPAQ